MNCVPSVGYTKNFTKTDKLFTTIAEFGENKNIVARVRFMAKDLAELRSNKWLPRALTKKLDETAAAPSATPPSPAPSATPQIPLSLLNRSSDEITAEDA